MTKAFNLGQLANNVDETGKLNGTNGLTGIAPASAKVQMANLTIQQSGANKIVFIRQSDSVTIASLDDQGNFIAKGNVTAYGTP